MKLKQRLEDFRVRELLAEGVLLPAGGHRVYRVTKKKLTSIEAADRLAREAGTAPADVAMAGLKDRQGVTVQHMSLPRGREVRIREADLHIESIGFADEALQSSDSTGNSFEVVARSLEQRDLTTLRGNLEHLREHGLVNYFDAQRFGNLRHNQGWIALQLMRGEHEQALKACLASISPSEDRGSLAFKSALLGSWGDWHACRDIAGKFGQHHSVFEHLKKHDGDFAGAFYHVASRLRLIHLYAFQSLVWNRSAAEYVRRLVPLEQRVMLEGIDGPLVYSEGPLPLDASMGGSWPLAGPRLEGIEHPLQREISIQVLAGLGLEPEGFDIQGVPGFQLKGEQRALVVVPRHLRVRPAEPDGLNPPLRLVKVRFELPRGAYATLVVRRLLARPVRETGEREPQGAAVEDHGARRGWSPRREGDAGGRRSPRDEWRESKPHERGPRHPPGERERGHGARSLEDRGPSERGYRPQHGRRPDERGGHGSARAGERGGGHGYGERGYGQHGYGERGYGQRGYGQRGYGERRYDERRYGEHDRGRPRKDHDPARERRHDEGGRGEGGHGQHRVGERQGGPQRWAPRPEERRRNEGGRGERGHGQHGVGERHGGPQRWAPRPEDRRYEPRGRGAPGDERGRYNRPFGERRPHFERERPGGRRGAPDQGRPFPQRDERFAREERPPRWAPREGGSPERERPGHWQPRPFQRRDDERRPRRFESERGRPLRDGPPDAGPRGPRDDARGGPRGGYHRGRRDDRGGPRLPRPEGTPRPEGPPERAGGGEQAHEES